MPQTAAVMIHLFFTLFSFSSIPWASSSGLMLKLIHRDSPLSPLYQPNLSDSERFMININISEARASYLQKQSGVKDALSLRLPLKLTIPVFTVEIRIGTPAVKRTLIFDTGSDLTWTQCIPCLKCFKQNEPLFDPKKSTSYKPITRSHPLAKSFKCSSFFTSKGCTYSARYTSRQTSAGVAATEAFTFHTDAGAPTIVSNIAFGCGKSSSGVYPPQISGILGMDRGPRSLARQLGSVIKSRFSYCLSDSPDKSSYLRFGDEAVIRGRNVQRSPFLNYSTLIRDTSYGLKLNDVSINGQKLGLGQALFHSRCIIDSGSSITYLDERALSSVRVFLDKYFAQFNNVRKYMGRHNGPRGSVCYTKQGDFSKFPTLKFHLQGADYHVPVENLFIFIDDDEFCLAMSESRRSTTLGLYQQRNVRIVYDLKQMMLSFAPDDCSKESFTTK